MVEMTKKQKRGSISEEEVSTILKRYPATTVLTLLQEVAKVADVKIDWNELVKKTNTGISSAREYQMLWRHLAYRNALLERLDEEDQPLVFNLPDRDTRRFLQESFPKGKDETWASFMVTQLQKWFQSWAIVILRLGTLGSQPAAITQEVACFLGQDLKHFMSLIPVVHLDLFNVFSLEAVHEGAISMDDDSDLEYELEGFPTVSSEASMEAAAFVKVLITSGLLSDSSLPNGSTIKAPLTINIPNRQSTGDPSGNPQLTYFVHGTNITIPVSVKKSPGSSGKGLKANGSASVRVPAQKKRKTWTPAEDDILKAAVERCGEGNWETISKGYFNDDRNPGQLYQRWAIIRKRSGNKNVAGGGSQPSEGQLAAAHRAMSLALDRPRAGSSLGPQSQQHRSQQDSGSMGPQRVQIQAGSTPHPRVRPPAKSAVSRDKMVKAAAVAAGARIATALDAQVLLKVAQAKNAVHRIMPVGASCSSLIKSSVAVTGNPNPLPTMHHNVHYIHTGVAATPAPPPRSARPGISQQAQGNIQSNKSGMAPEPNASTSEATPIPQNDQREQVENNQSSSAAGQTEEVQDGFSGEDGPKEDGASVSGNKLEELLEKDTDASGLGDASDKQVSKDGNGLPS
ncbi:hypothetical protein LguiA_006485 [Lonicera macranthoides]